MNRREMLASAAGLVAGAALPESKPDIVRGDRSKCVDVWNSGLHGWVRFEGPNPKWIFVVPRNVMEMMDFAK